MGQEREEWGTTCILPLLAGGEMLVLRGEPEEFRRRM